MTKAEKINKELIEKYAERKSDLMKHHETIGFNQVNEIDIWKD